MKRKLAAIFAAVMIAFTSAGLFTACSFEKADIVVTIFPEYDWVMNVLGENKSDFKVKLLMDSGADLHNYSPKPDDMRAIGACKLFVYVGGESDAWVDDALKTKPNSERIAINLLEVLGENAKIEDPIEEEHEHEEGEDHDHEEEYDEHVWLSLKNAGLFVDEILAALKNIDAENADAYTENAATYKAKLNALDEKYLAATDSAEIKTLLFADRFPFRYLVDDYGLNYIAAKSGCSADNNIPPQKVKELAQAVKDFSLTTVLILEGSDKTTAQTVIAQAGQIGYTAQVEIRVLNSLQAATLKEYADGKTYLSVMESNLTVLKAALKVAE